ncbi:ADP-ribosylation/Crystallin J1, partial [Mycena olivaceomarginata]
TKIRLALLAKALCDALGGPAEFHPRFSTPFLSHMAPNDNFGLPAGVWTDDTSMALRLRGRSRRGMDAADQLDAYYHWWRAGELSATGRCFDIGNTIRRALGLYEDALRAAGAVDKPRSVLPALFRKSERERRRKAAATALPRIARDLSGSVFGGNGSLMRVLPVGLAYWRKEEGKVGDLARESSGTTHPNAVCQEACAAWATCVARVVRTAAVAERMQQGLGMTKLDVLHHFASYPTPNADADDLVEARTLAVLPQAAALPSSGYVVHTLAAALYAFLATSTFEAGALLTANMGDDADTVAAVYGGLAGAWYAVEEVVGSRPRGTKRCFGRLGCESGGTRW